MRGGPDAYCTLFCFCIADHQPKRFYREKRPRSRPKQALPEAWICRVCWHGRSLIPQPKVSHLLQLSFPSLVICVQPPVNWYFAAQFTHFPPFFLSVSLCTVVAEVVAAGASLCDGAHSTAQVPPVRLIIRKMIVT